MNNYMQQPYYYNDSGDIYRNRLAEMNSSYFNTQQGNMVQNSPQNNVYSNLYNNNQNALNMQNPAFEVHIVNSIDEVNKKQAPFNGATAVFIDAKNKMIYTKQLNMTDGTADLISYQRIDNKDIPNVEKPVEYVKKSEFDELKLKFDELWNALTAKPAETKAEPKTTKKEGK